MEIRGQKKRQKKKKTKKRQIARELWGNIQSARVLQRAEKKTWATGTKFMNSQIQKVH